MLTNSIIGPKSFHLHLLNSQERKKSARGKLLATLMLTPMVDMFSLLVIFLLQVFSTSPQTLVATKGIDLPQAATGSALKDAPILSLTSEEVFLDKKPLGSIKEVLGNPTALVTQLEAFRETWYKSHPSGHFPGEIMLEAHRELPSTVVSQFMALLPGAQFGSIQLLTLPGGGQAR